MQAQLPQSQSNQIFDQIFDKIWASFSDIHHDYKIQYTQKSKSAIKSSLNNSSLNYALGAMYGAFMGDALGSYLQFNKNITPNLIDKGIVFDLSSAMQMPGAGTFEFLKPGQFTDDSQMASHMLSGLYEYDPTKDLYKQEKQIIVKIAQQYLQWYNSRPFDIGITTRVALAQIQHLFKNHKLNKKSYEDIEDFYDHLKDTFQMISIKNEKSQSNGSLMRITPMAFFVSTLIKNGKDAAQKSFGFYEDFIEDQIKMTHGNQGILESSKSWADLLVQMILRQNKSVSQVYKNFEEKYRENGERNYKHVQEWIKDSKKQEMNAMISMGWAKIAYTIGLRQLRELIEKEKNQQEIINASTFKQIMKYVLNLQGDTDTNAAIVGGLIGAVVGFKNLPYEYLQKQFDLTLNLDKKKFGSRGSQYEPRRQFLKAISMIQRIEKQKGENNTKN